jgi:hypothetical protein
VTSRWRAAALAIVPMLLLISACGGAALAGDSYKIATAPGLWGAIQHARVEGVLHGQSNIDGIACFWIDDAPDSRALSWPYGYTARANPLAVYDETGHRLVAVGQFVVMDGGLLANDVHSIVGCQDFTRFWGVGRWVFSQQALRTTTATKITTA